MLGPQWGVLPSPSKLKVSGTHCPFRNFLAKIAGVIETRQDVMAGTECGSLQAQYPHT